MDPTLTLIAAGAAVLLLLIILVRRLRAPLDRFDDQDGPEEPIKLGEGDMSIDVSSTRRKAKPSRSANGCDHHYEMRGFPADRLGTHVIVVCTKCEEKQVVPLAEGEKMLRQRDDVREAIQRARGGKTNS